MGNDDPGGLDGQGTRFVVACSEDGASAPVSQTLMRRLAEFVES